jgi:dolichol-phosphate mannosyltransferase
MSSVTGVLSPLPVPRQIERAQQKLALVIPTLCEAENIGGLLRQVRSILDAEKIPYEILVVDDDSCDGTSDVVTAIALEDPRVRLLVRKGERGLSGAILYGWQRTDAEILGVMDADLQHPPELLPKLIAPILEGRDLVIGSRYTAGGDLGGWNPTRKLLSAAAVWVTWPLQKPRLRAKDPMSGFFLVRRKCLEKVTLQPAGFKLLLEILVRARIHPWKRFRSSSGYVFAEPAKPTSKSQLITRCFWQDFMPANLASRAVPEIFKARAKSCAAKEMPRHLRRIPAPCESPARD